MFKSIVFLNTLIVFIPHDVASVKASVGASHMEWSVSCISNIVFAFFPKYYFNTCRDRAAVFVPGYTHDTIWQKLLQCTRSPFTQHSEIQEHLKRDP